MTIGSAAGGRWAAAFAVLLAASAGIATPRKNGFPLEPSAVPVREIRRGGPSRAEIPALVHPRSVPADEAPWDDDERVIVGLNKFQIDDEPEPSVFPIDPTLEGAQRARLAGYKANRVHSAVDATLESVRAAARGTDNLLYPMKEALRAGATLGEVSDALRDVFGMYQP